MKRREKSNSEQQSMADKIVGQLVAADSQGIPYIAALLNGEIVLSELFEKEFEPLVKRKVYDTLRLWEQTQSFTH